MRTMTHACRFSDGEIVVETFDDGRARLLTRELPDPSKDEDESDCDVTVVETRDPAVLLELASALVRAAAVIMPPNRAAGGPTPTSLAIMVAFAAELEALKLVDGAGI